MSCLSLIAAADDFLLEEALNEVVVRACADFDGVEAEILPPETTPEQLAVELCSPSLFAPSRVLVTPDISVWLEEPGPRRKPKTGGKSRVPDVGPLVALLQEQLPEQVALVMGAVCSRKPKGDLVEAIDKSGTVEWMPVPEAPKPWEDVVLSQDQAGVLRGVLRRAVGEVGFTPEAERLLLERLGFAPRLLAQEGRKLATAATGGVVDEDLVRALSFPRERSLDVILDALLDRRAAPILDLIAASLGGIPVLDRQGKIMDEGRVSVSLVGQASAVFQQLLYLRRAAADIDLADEMLAGRTARPLWYVRTFRDGIAPALVTFLEGDAPSPVVREKGKAPKPWYLSKLFAGAGRYSDEELAENLGELGELEAATRGPLAMDAVFAWFARALG
ncbi:MAG: hypothetical protein ACC742_03810 [Thermoanaerobaculales bacterium]